VRGNCVERANFEARRVSPRVKKSRSSAVLREPTPRVVSLFVNCRSSSSLEIGSLRRHSLSASFATIQLWDSDRGSRHRITLASGRVLLHQRHVRVVLRGTAFESHGDMAGASAVRADVHLVVMQLRIY